VEAARTAREAGADVTLFSGEDVVPYFRPRLVALAFGQAEFPAIQMHPAAWYAGQGIDLRLDSRVDSLAVDGAGVSVGDAVRFDGAVIASGAAPIVPPVGAPAPAGVLPLWSVAHAQAIRRRVKRGGGVTIVGGGILGIEAALRAVEAGMHVELVELMDRLMPAQFGARASAVLLRRLRDMGIGVMLGRRLTSAADSADGRLRMVLDDGRAWDTDLCLVSIGARPDRGLAAAAGCTVERGVVVDAHLRTSRPHCFAAGDLIQFQGLTRCSVREAASQGRIAGANVVRSLKGEPLQPYRPETLPLTFKSRDFELYSIGHAGGDGCEEHLLEGTTESIIRSLIIRDGIPLGVQMIGTRQGFDEYADLIKRGPPG
jgi:NAD(P)H-nitrite reductase large subunit